MNTKKSQADLLCDSLTTLKGSLVLMKTGMMGPVNREQEKFLGISLEALENLIMAHNQTLQRLHPSPTRRLLMPRLSMTSVHI